MTDPLRNSRGTHCGVISKRTGLPCQRVAVNGGPCVWHDPARKPIRFWTTTRLMELADMIERGMSDAVIATHFGTSAEAIRLARKRHGIHARSRYLLSTRAIAAELGIPCSKTVARWITRRYLRGKRGQTWGPYRQWYVLRDHLIDFLDDPRYWHLWEPERITDPAMRAHYRQRRTERFLTTGEAAERCYVTHATVLSWIERGELPAVRRGNWLIPESALVGFVAPGQRSKAGLVGRAWTDHEIATLCELRARGWSYRRIGISMDRTTNSVANRWLRLEAQRLECAA